MKDVTVTLSGNLNRFKIGRNLGTPLNYGDYWDVIKVKNSLIGNGVVVISLKKLDGSKMFLNEDLIERVEEAADGQSAVYLINGGHIVVANQADIVVEKVRTEKANLLRRVREEPLDPQPGQASPHQLIPEMTLLTEVRE